MVVVKAGKERSPETFELGVGTLERTRRTDGPQSGVFYPHIHTDPFDLGPTQKK